MLHYGVMVHSFGIFGQNGKKTGSLNQLCVFFKGQGRRWGCFARLLLILNKNISVFVIMLSSGVIIWENSVLWIANVIFSALRVFEGYQFVLNLVSSILGCVKQAHCYVLRKRIEVSAFISGTLVSWVEFANQKLKTKASLLFYSLIDYRLEFCILFEE